MRLAAAVLVCAVFALAEEPKPGPSPDEKELARLLELADFVKDALSHGNLPAAKREAAELSAGIEQRERRFKFAEAEALVPADGPDRLFRLADAAGHAYEASDYVKAEKYARDVLSLASENPDSPNYGDAIFKGNMVLGRLALTRNKNVEDAKRALLESGKTPGSPVLRSYGPNMSLAKDLLEIGERDVVLQFFDQCRAFWKRHDRTLDEWSETIKTCCRMPKFGNNLHY